MSKGAYYKERYGGGGRGKGGCGKGGGGKGGGGKGGGRGGRDSFGGELDGAGSGNRARGGTCKDLRSGLEQLEGRPYPAYRDLEGYEFELVSSITLVVHHVQSDPFAPPTRCYLSIPRAAAGFPSNCFSTKPREVALRDLIARRFARDAKLAGVDQRTETGGWHGGKGGEVTIDGPGQYVLERSAVVVTAEAIELRFTVALPAQGRSIMGHWAAFVLADTLPRLAADVLLCASYDPSHVKAHLDSVEDQVAARAQLPGLGLVAFVADGSLLPRASGASDAPLTDGHPVLFASPPSLRTTLLLPNAGKVEGMGIRCGVTLIVGGGFHGKSTLLQALQVGIYDKVRGKPSRPLSRPLIPRTLVVAGLAFGKGTGVPHARGKPPPSSSPSRSRLPSSAVNSKPSSDRRRRERICSSHPTPLASETLPALALSLLRSAALKQRY